MADKGDYTYTGPAVPTQFHAVPENERAVDANGKRLPWSLEWPELVLTAPRFVNIADHITEDTPMRADKRDSLKKKVPLVNRFDAKDPHVLRGLRHRQRRTIPP